VPLQEEERGMKMEQSNIIIKAANWSNLSMRLKFQPERRTQAFNQEGELVQFVSPASE
jgi:hypothetical protein